MRDHDALSGFTELFKSHHIFSPSTFSPAKTPIAVNVNPAASLDLMADLVFESLRKRTPSGPAVTSFGKVSGVGSGVGDGVGEAVGFGVGVTNSILLSIAKNSDLSSVYAAPSVPFSLVLIELKGITRAKVKPMLKATAMSITGRCFVYPINLLSVAHVYV